MQLTLHPILFSSSTRLSRPHLGKRRLILRGQKTHSSAKIFPRPNTSMSSIEPALADLAAEIVQKLCSNEGPGNEDQEARFRARVRSLYYFRELCPCFQSLVRSISSLTLLADGPNVMLQLPEATFNLEAVEKIMSGQSFPDLRLFALRSYLTQFGESTVESNGKLGDEVLRRIQSLMIKLMANGNEGDHRRALEFLRSKLGWSSSLYDLVLN